MEFDSVFRHHTERYRQTQRDTQIGRGSDTPFNFRARDVLFGLVRAMSFLRKGCSGVVVGVGWGGVWREIAVGRDILSNPLCKSEPTREEVLV